MLYELMRRVEGDEESFVITRREKPVAVLRAASWVHRVAGLFADHPEVCDEIDKVYAERHLDKPRYVDFSSGEEG